MESSESSDSERNGKFLYLNVEMERKGNRYQNIKRCSIKGMKRKIECN